MTHKHSVQDIDFLRGLFRLFFPFNSSTVPSSQPEIDAIFDKLKPEKLSFVYAFFKFYFGIDLKHYSFKFQDCSGDFKTTDGNLKLAGTIIDFLKLDRVYSKYTDDAIRGRKRLKFKFGSDFSANGYSYRHGPADREERRKYDFRSQNQDKTDTSSDYRNIKQCLTDAINKSVEYGLNTWSPDWNERLVIKYKSGLFFKKFLLAVMCFADVNSGVSNKSKELEVFVNSYLEEYFSKDKQRKDEEDFTREEGYRQELAICLVKMAKFFSSQFQKSANKIGLKTGRIYPDENKPLDQMVGLRLHRVAQGPIIFDVFKDLILSPKEETLFLILKNKRIATTLKERELSNKVSKSPEVPSSRVNDGWTHVSLVDEESPASRLPTASRPAPLPAPPKKVSLRPVVDARGSAQRGVPSQVPAVSAELSLGYNLTRGPNSVERLIHSSSAGGEAKPIDLVKAQEDLQEKIDMNRRKILSRRFRLRNPGLNKATSSLTDCRSLNPAHQASLPHSEGAVRLGAQVRRKECLEMIEGLTRRLNAVDLHKLSPSPDKGKASSLPYYLNQQVITEPIPGLQADTLSPPPSSSPAVISGSGLEGRSHYVHKSLEGPKVRFADSEPSSSHLHPRQSPSLAGGRLR